MSTTLPPTKPPAEVHPMQALLDQEGSVMPQRGDICNGEVISVSPQEVVIDLRLKREAVVPASDLARLDKETLAEIQPGTSWPVYILQQSDREGNLLVSLSRALQEKDWLVAQQAMENNDMIEVEVVGHNSGGVEVAFLKLRGFVPASHLSMLPREMTPEDRKAKMAAMVGTVIPVKVVEVDRKRRRLIMSERAARRRWQREHRKQLLDDIQVGEVRTGIVRSLADFGAFVDLGGADGLIHISELAWFPVGHPSDVLKVGQQVDVKVLRIDKSRDRIGLSLKRVQPDPWSSIEDLYKVNELIEAVVTRVTEFGAFVRLRSGVEGLLHVSEMADIRPDHPQSLVNPGDLLLLRVLRIEPERRRIGLSLRAVSETEWAEWAASYREKQAPKAEAEVEAAPEVAGELPASEVAPIVSEAAAPEAEEAAPAVETVAEAAAAASEEAVPAAETAAEAAAAASEEAAPAAETAAEAAAAAAEEAAPAVETVAEAAAAASEEAAPAVETVAEAAAAAAEEAAPAVETVAEAAAAASEEAAPAVETVAEAAAAAAEEAVPAVETSAEATSAAAEEAASAAEAVALAIEEAPEA